MTNKDFMLSSLKDLLLEGETLSHPIYGVLERDGTNYGGFFGFTETCLLVVLLNGSSVLCTERLELDIRSFSYRQKGRKYVISITFSDYFACRIHASEKPLFREDQTKQLGGFIRFLSSVAPKEQQPDVNTATGKKIRRQYFTFALYAVYTIAVMISVTYALFDIRSGTFVLGKWLNTSAEVVGILLPLAVIFAVLYVLNRFFFGKTLCVSDEKGIYTERGLIEWYRLSRAEYVPQISSRRRVKYCYLLLFVTDEKGKETAVRIDHFPYYGLGEIRKACPAVEAKMSKRGRWLVAGYIFLPFVVPFIVALIKSL